MKRGFTLLEILIVVAIIGILVTIFVIKNLGGTLNAEAQKNNINEKILETVLRQSQLENTALPFGNKIQDYKSISIETETFLKKQLELAGSKQVEQDYTDLKNHFVQISVSKTKKLGNLTDAEDTYFMIDDTSPYFPGSFVSYSPLQVSKTEKKVQFISIYTASASTGIGINNPNPEEVFVQSVSLTSYMNFMSSYHRTIAIKSNGTLWGFGDSSHGELGVVTSTPFLIQKQIGTDSDWVSVWATDYNTFARKKDGTLWEWGSNKGTSLPVKVNNDKDWLKILSIENTNFALKKDGTLVRWGAYDELITFGDPGGHLQNPTVIGNQKWRDITYKFSSPISNHMIGIQIDGTLWGIGDNTLGQLGQGYKSDSISSSWVPIGSDRDWKLVSSSTVFSYAIKEDGSLWVFGSNPDCNFMTMNCSPEEKYIKPTLYDKTAKWKTVKSSLYGTIAQKEDGTYWKLGFWLEGDPTDPSKKKYYKTPVPLSTAMSIKYADNSDTHGAYITKDGSLYTWGLNKVGQLGNGTKENKYIYDPAIVKGDSDWK